MSGKGKILGYYCLFSMIAMFLAGLVIRLIILGLGSNIVIGCAIYAILFWQVARLLLGMGPRPDPAVQAGSFVVASESAGSEFPCPAGTWPGGPSQGPEGFGDPGGEVSIGALAGPEGDGLGLPGNAGQNGLLGAGNEGRPFLEVFDSHGLTVTLAILFFDLLYLALAISSKFSPILTVSSLALHVSLWGTAAISLVFASSFSHGSIHRKSTILVFALTFAHLFLTFLGHDLFVARCFVLVVSVWTILMGEGLFSRAVGPILACLYFAMETIVGQTELFALFQGLDWPNPLSGPELAYDYSLKFAAIQISGLWGMGRESLATLDFVFPNLMYFNGLSYLNAMYGNFSVIVYSLLNFSTLMAMGWLILNSVKVCVAVIILPLWMILVVDQFFTNFFFLAWRAFGITHGPAFVGSYEMGLLILILMLAILDPKNQKISNCAIV
jgi:hypothetical protein